MSNGTSPKLRCILDQTVLLPTMYHWDDAISVFCRKENFAFLSDRFGYLNQFSRIDAAAISEGRFPSSSSTKKFSDIMRERAIELYTRCKINQCECVILWSGGCDSTSVIAAFFDVCEDTSFLRILHTKSSIEEYPEFYQILKKRNIKTQCENVRDIFAAGLNLAKQGHLLIYGFPADQLFGSIIGQTYEGDTTKIHWASFLKADKANQQYEAAFQYYGLPIKTIAEFLWFNNFALKWDYVCNWTIATEHDTSENIVSFFDTYDFECWSVSNFDILHRYDQKDIKNYKLEMKNFIYSVLGLDSVYNLKKVPSIAYAYNVDNFSIHATQRKISGLDDRGVIHTIDFPDNFRPLDGDVAGVCATSIMRKFLKRRDRRVH